MLCIYYEHKLNIIFTQWQVLFCWFLYHFSLARPDVAYDVPDRRTGRQGLLELRRLNPYRQWNFVEVGPWLFMNSVSLSLSCSRSTNSNSNTHLFSSHFTIYMSYLVSCLTCLLHLFQTCILCDPFTAFTLMDRGWVAGRTSCPYENPFRWSQRFSSRTTGGGPGSPEKVAIRWES